MQEIDFANEFISCGALFTYKSGQLLIGWGNREWLTEPDHSQPCFYFPDYFLKDAKPWFVHEHCQLINTNEFLHILNEVDVPITSPPDWQNPDKETFDRSFFDIQNMISKDQLKKAVPFIYELAEKRMDETQLVKSLKSILNYALSNPVHLYGFWEAGGGILGATPEVLFQCNADGFLNTMACAGTKNSKDHGATLLSDPKELYEHELVVEGIKESLSPYGKVCVGNIQLLKLSHLTHLVTPLNVQLEAPPVFQDIVKALHPTPAVGAFPKEAGRKWLEEYEVRINRFRFGAPAGYLLPENLESKCYVSIRNVQWQDNTLRISAGCGVVADSRCEREWAEIDLKLKAIKEMLAL